MESTIYDVAKLAGVSISTVSRVINNKANVNEDTRNKVLEAIRLLDFYPSMSARGLTQKKTKTIGIYEPFQYESFFNSYSLEYFKGVYDVTSKANYNLLMISDIGGRIPTYVKILKERRIDGLIIPSVDQNEIYLAALVEKSYPIVYTGKHINSQKGYNIYAHYEEYVVEVLTGLCAKGHKNIIVINGTRNRNMLLTSKLIKSFCTEHNVNLSRKNIIFCDNENEDLHKDLLELLNQKKYTAIFADSMKSAQDTLNILHREGYEIPKDISIVCVEHIKNEAGTLYPPISSIFVPAFDMGKAAANLILEVIRNKALPSRQIEISPIYIDRDSASNI